MRDTRIFTSSISPTSAKNDRVLPPPPGRPSVNTGRARSAWALGEAAHHPERLTAAAELRQTERLAVDAVEETVAPFEHLVGPRHAALRELNGEDRFARGFGRGACLPVRQRADARLIERHIARDVNADGMHDLRRREPQHAARAGDGGKPDDRGIVHADRPVVQHIADAAKHLVGQHGAGDQIPPAASHHFGSR